MWYCNPGWWAIIVSAGALGVSCCALRNSRRATKSSVENRITELSTKINDAFVAYEVKTPYAVKLGIPNDRDTQFASKVVLLLHQINLLRLVYENRDVLGSTPTRSYANWATNVLQPWIESDDDLGRALTLVRDAKDTYHADFIAWLCRILPAVYAPEASRPSPSGDE